MERHAVHEPRVIRRARCGKTRRSVSELRLEAWRAIEDGGAQADGSPQAEDPRDARTSGSRGQVRLAAMPRVEADAASRDAARIEVRGSVGRRLDRPDAEQGSSSPRWIRGRFAFVRERRHARRRTRRIASIHRRKVGPGLRLAIETATSTGLRRRDDCRLRHRPAAPATARSEEDRRPGDRAAGRHRIASATRHRLHRGAAWAARDRLTRRGLGSAHDRFGCAEIAAETRIAPAAVEARAQAREERKQREEQGGRAHRDPQDYPAIPARQGASRPRLASSRRRTLPDRPRRAAEQPSGVLPASASRAGRRRFAFGSSPPRPAERRFGHCPEGAAP